MRWMNVVGHARRVCAKSAITWIATAAMLAACGGGGDASGGTGGVTNPPPVVVGAVSVTLSATSARVGATVTATAEVRSTAGAVLTGRAISWASGNSAIATVTSGGTITAVAPGTVSIAATADGISGSATLTVTPPPVQTVVVTLANASIAEGSTTTATAALTDDRGAAVTGRAIAWSSSAPTVATVDSTGRVTAVTSGTSTITATSEGKSGTAVITVTPAPVQSVTVSTPTAQLALSRTMTATAVLRDARNAVLTGRAVSWTSSDVSIASVNAAGVITGVALGSATITATAEGKSGTATVTIVPPPVQTVSVTLANATVNQGNTTQASVLLQDDLGAILVGRAVTWASSTPAVATVDANGLVTAVGVGSTTISATSEGKSGQATLTVLAVPVASVAVTLSAGSLVPGLTAQASAVARDAAGGVLTGRPVSWSSTSPSVASVNAQGVVLGVSPGSTTITATVEGRVGQILVTVAPPVTSVVFNGALRQKAGDGYPMTLTMRIADGTIVSRPVAWRVLESARATVTANGVVTPTGAGTYTLIADIEGSSWSATYTAYDWVALSSGGTLFQSLDGDALVTSRFGVSNYPQLVASCDLSGFFFVWVRTPNAITANGSIAYAFDGGTIFTELWDELSPNFNTLWKRGSNTTIKSFATQIALARRFTIAFNEFNGPARVADFRVSGLAERLPPLLAQCPAALRAGSSDGSISSAQTIASRLASQFPSSVSLSSASDAAMRAATGSSSASSPLLDGWPVWKSTDSQPAIRLRR